MSQLQRKILFPTAVYFKDIPNAKELNKYLFKEIKKWRKADPEGEENKFWFWLAQQNRYG